MSITNRVLDWWNGLHGSYPETIRWDVESGQGSSGKTVEMWQAVIGAQQDGSFGPQTDSATRQWQADHGIDPDGVVGPLTWKAAMKDVGTSKSPGLPSGAPQGTRPLSQAVANKPAITAFAVETLNNSKEFPMGGMNRRTVAGVDIVARIEPHTWTHRQGKLVTGLNPPIRGVTLYEVVDPAIVAAGDSVPFADSQSGKHALFWITFGGSTLILYHYLKLLQKGKL
jgi:hypothetical protein